MECCSAGFSARRFCSDGRNNKGGKFRNFESTNKMSKVDTEGGENFCSSPKLFQDTSIKFDLVLSSFVLGSVIEERFVTRK